MPRRRVRRKRPFRDAMSSVEQAGYGVTAAVRILKAAALEATDGIHVKLVRTDKQHTLFDFFTGEVDELPFEVRIDLLEEGDSPIK